MFKIVIIEDEELLRMGLTTFINWQELGYDMVGEAGDGRKALQLIQEKKPDVVITDIKMPHMDGIEMAEILKSEMPELRIIIISGYDEFEYAKRALHAGVSEYILKPIKMDHIKEVMCRIRDELKEYRKQRDEYQELKNGREEEKRIKRKNLYEKLLLHQCSLDEISEERERIEEYVENRYYAVGLLAIQNFSVLYMDCDYSLIMERDYELGKIIEQCIQESFVEGERRCIDLLRVNYGERLLCICCEKRERLKELVGEIEEAFKGLSNELEQLEITFGQSAMNLEGLLNSYRNARKMSEQKFMRSWQDATMCRSTGNNMIQFMNYDTSNLCFEIKNGSQAGIERALMELKDSLSKQNITSYLQLVLIISNIYYVLVKIPEEAGGNITDVIGNPQDYYQKLIGKAKREDMVEELGNFCMDLHRYFIDLSVNRKQEVMKRIELYLQEHFSEESLSMKDVAEFAYVSVSYLGMIIKREANKTFTEYLTDIRIEKAKQYLTTTTMKNYEVAEACGYSTPAYFSTVFKGVCGLTPSEYRNMNKKTTNNNHS